MKLAALAILADTALLISPLIHARTVTATLVLVGAHAALCAAMAALLLPFLPARLRQRRGWSWLLLFDLCFMAPVVGPLATFVAVMFLLRRKRAQQQAFDAHGIVLPAFELKARQVERAAQGALRSRLATHLPPQMRMQSLLALQAVPRRMANPILESLLADHSDDIRLVAFGMLDAEEKRLSGMIQQERAALAAATTPSRRAEVLRNLAELHWELIYASLATGELRTHMLHEARRLLEEALALTVAPSPGMHLLHGRILMALGERAAARAAIVFAFAQGQPAASTLPYIAEIDFHNRDFAAVRTYLEELTRFHVVPRLEGIIDIWTGRDFANRFRDRRILPHI